MNPNIIILVAEDDSNKKFMLLLDIRMPKIDGIEILEKMKEDDELKNIPVISRISLN